MFRSIRLLLALSLCALLVIGFNTTFVAAGGKGKGKDTQEYNKKSEDKKEISSEDKKERSSEDKVEAEDETDSDEKAEKKKQKKHRKRNRKGQKKSEQWMPPGLSKKEKAQWAEGKPPGWSKGKKTGWGGSDMPPGLQKKDKNDIEKWKKDRAEASEKTETLIRNRDHDKNSETIENNAQSVSLAVNETVNAGVPADQVVALVRKSIDKDMSGEDIERVIPVQWPRV